MTLILALAVAFAQPAITELAEVTRELTRLEQQLAATWKEGDCSAWGAMLAPEWSVIHITGAVITKPEALQMCKAPAVSIEEFDVDDISVRLFGDAAVVTGRTRVVTGGAPPGEVTLRFTDVFIRRAGRWQVVASHATRLGS
ncbi:MAG TPA: nuclear transport factor 2 family protein [Vicinamibacterales bacterium]|nr:nuclear transport factor 2 family protein [Vicinamibacterales bacterium]